MKRANAIIPIIAERKVRIQDFDLNIHEIHVHKYINLILFQGILSKLTETNAI